MTDFQGHILPRNLSVSSSGGGGGTVTGSGASPQVAYWSGTSSLTGSPLFEYQAGGIFLGNMFDTTYALTDAYSQFAQTLDLELYPSSGYVETMNIFTDIHPTTSRAANILYISLEVDATVNPTNTQNINSVYGLSVEANNAGSGTAGEVTGITASGFFTTGSGNITNCQAGAFSVGNEGTGTIANGYGVRIYPAFGGGTITNAYGLYIDAQTHGTNIWSLYTNAGQVSFGDNVVIRGSKGIIVGNEGDPTYATTQAYSQFEQVLNLKLAAENYVEVMNIYADINPTTSAAASMAFNTVEADAETNAACTQNMSQVYAIGANFAHFGSGNITNGCGAIVSGVHNTGSGVVTTLTGIQTIYANLGTGSVTNAYGIYVENPTNDGANARITNGYGLYIQTQGSATNNWAIYTNLGKVQFGDNVSVGGSLSGTAAALELISTTQGFLPTRMTTTQRNAISAVEGLIVHDTTIHGLFSYQNGSWVQL